jgi:protein-S-isoprenylcysteine O-methyltransferase Ste14
MTVFAYSVLAAGWLFWFAPFLLINAKSGTARKIDPRARWGILLAGVAYAALWQTPFWEHPPVLWQVALELLFFALAATLSWTARRALGKQWRIEAGLNADHELITSGPYRILRHPIYTSMLCTLLGTGVLITPWWLLLISIVIFIAGTEIRVRVEDSLLSSHFGDRFQDYKQNVPAYIPFLR